MKKLQIWFALFFSWLFVLYNIERLHAPINLASFVYVLAAALAIPVVLFPKLQQAPTAWLAGATVPVVLSLKAWFDYPITGHALPLTLTEVGTTALTVCLAQKVGRSLEDLRIAAITTLLTHLHDNTRPFEQGQSDIYREIRRARMHGRPLAMLAVSAPTRSIDLCLDRLTVEMQRDCVRNYAQAKIAELLSTEMNSCEIITHHGSHFVTVVPETGREQARQLAERLKKLARERLGLELSIGTSLFPDDEITFVKLMERAEAQMLNSASAAEIEAPSDAESFWEEFKERDSALQPATEG